MRDDLISLLLLDDAASISLCWPINLLACMMMAPLKIRYFYGAGFFASRTDEFMPYFKHDAAFSHAT